MTIRILEKIFAFLLAVIATSNSYSQEKVTEPPLRKFGFGLSASPFGPQDGMELSYRFDRKNSLVLERERGLYKRHFALSFRNNFWRNLFLDLGLAYGSYTIFAGSDSFSRNPGVLAPEPVAIPEPTASSPGFAMTLKRDYYGYTIERQYIASIIGLSSQMPLGFGIDLGIEWVGKTLPFKEYGRKIKYRRPELYYQGPIEEYWKSEASLDNIFTVYLGYSL